MCHCNEIKAWAEAYLKETDSTNPHQLVGRKVVLNQLLDFIRENCENVLSSKCHVKCKDGWHYMDCENPEVWRK